MRLILLSFLPAVLAAPVTIHRHAAKPVYWLLAGDSTTATNGGWGDAFLSSTTVANGSSGHNYGHSGATTKSFRDGVTGPMSHKTLFRHNDQKPTSGVSLSSYRTNLQTFASEVLTSGGTPILVTHLTRRTFNTTTNRVIENLSNKTAITLDVANSNGLRFINLNKASTNYVNTIGQQGADTYNWSENGTTGKGRTPCTRGAKVVFARMVSDLLVGKYTEDFEGVTKGNETLSRLIREGKVA